MDDQNITNEELEEVTEVEIDQEEDFTSKIIAIRKTLRFRVPLAVFATAVYFVIRAIDKNVDFNPVNAAIFTLIAVIILILGFIIYYFDYTTKSEFYGKKETYRQYKILHEIFDFMSVVPYLMLAVTISNAFFLSFSPISGTSMEPNFSDNEAVVFSHFGSSYERFDVVIVYEESLSDPYLIKRIIGLPGESVEIRENEIYINGTLIVQDFIDQDKVNTVCFGQSTPTCTYIVPMGSYFVLGDNRDERALPDLVSGYSIDSRTFGSVDKDNIYGKVIWKFKDNNLLN